MQDINDLKTLEELWEYTNLLHKKAYPGSSLEPIMAGGKTHKPNTMFVFINPTYRNVSSDANWEGKRRPWTGTKYIWRIFNSSGHFDSNLLEEIERKSEWDVAFADKVYDHLEDRGHYFTNIVKWTGENADLPDSHMVGTFLPILKREIELVDPESIVTFGLIPFNALIDEKIKLGEYYEKVKDSGDLVEYELKTGGKVYKVYPCYFPVGRGNPKRATELLKLLHKK